MTRPSKYEKKAEEVAEAHSSLGGFLFGTLVELIAIWKDAFKVLSQSFFILNWINEGLGVMWKTLALKWSYNKNMHQGGNLLLSWLQFGFSTLMVFGGVILVGIAEIALFGVMLLLNPFICFAKAIYYLGKTIAADNPKEAEAHYARVKENLAATLISGILGLCLAALLYLPTLPMAAAITLTTVVCVTLLPPIVIGLGSKLVSALGSMASSIAKGWRKM